MNETTSSLILHEPLLQEALLPAPIPWLWITLGTVVVIIAMITAIILLSRRKPTDPTAARRAAFEKALHEIEEAASLAPRMAAVQVSLAIRRYMSTAASDPSLFETHEEFLARHPSLTQWPADTIDSLVSTLKQLAEIKYRPLEASDVPADFLTESRALLEVLDSQSAA
jgi:hypothetical protein